MPVNNFDIYQTETGYMAVTNDVRRVILDALAKKDRGLPELVTITGKAKPTLSSVHMKELLQQRLVEELPHPTDNRRKVYRLLGRRIGSSSVPVEQLRSAVKHYVTVSPLAARIPLPLALEAMASAPSSTSADVLHAQAARLGKLTAHIFAQAEPRDLVTGIAGFLEQEGLAKPLRLDLENLVIEFELGVAFGEDLDPLRVAGLLAGYIEGVGRSRELLDAPVHVERLKAARRFALHLAGAAAGHLPDLE